MSTRTKSRFSRDWFTTDAVDDSEPTHRDKKMETYSLLDSERLILRTGSCIGLFPVKLSSSNGTRFSLSTSRIIVSIVVFLSLTYASYIILSSYFMKFQAISSGEATLCHFILCLTYTLPSVVGYVRFLCIMISVTKLKILAKQLAEFKISSSLYSQQLRGNRIAFLIWVLLVLFEAIMFALLHRVTNDGDATTETSSVIELFLSPAVFWCTIFSFTTWYFIDISNFVVLQDVTSSCKSLNGELKEALSHLRADTLNPLDIIEDIRLRFHKLSDIMSTLSEAYGKNFSASYFGCGFQMTNCVFLLSVTTAEAVRNKDFVHMIGLLAMMLFVWSGIAIISIVAEHPKFEVSNMILM
jgi:hypothetical protein